MSQNQEATPEAREQENFDALDEGFDLGMDEDQDGKKAEPEGQEQPEQPKEKAEPEVPFDQASQPEPNAQPQPANEVPPQVPAQPQPEEPKKIEAIPENIRDEYEELKNLNPKAAELALEDSPEGEAIRKRMASYGAEAAQDRAEVVLDRRDAEIEKARAQQSAVEAYNKRYMETIRQGNPEYFSLINDPKRKAEASQYFDSINDWIQSKPYKEAQPLLQIAQKGNANQVLQLIEKFESEKGGRKRADPTGALAVPGRGAPMAPAGIGDKDDLDAGWNLNKD